MKKIIIVALLSVLLLGTVAIMTACQNDVTQEAKDSKVLSPDEVRELLKNNKDLQSLRDFIKKQH